MSADSPAPLELVPIGRVESPLALREELAAGLRYLDLKPILGPAGER